MPRFNAALILLLALGSAQALPAVSRADDDQSAPIPASCKCVEKDEFDPESRAVAGPFLGQCLICEKRSVRRLTPTQAKKYLAADATGSTYLANVFVGGEFHVAKFFQNSVEDVIVQIEHFQAKVPAAHMQVRFRFAKGKEPVLITHVGGKKPKTIRDFVLSIEAVPARNTEFDLIQGGLNKYFGLAWRLMSLRDKVEDQIIKWNHQVDQYRLAMKPYYKQAIFAAAVKLSEASATGKDEEKVYDLVDKSCTTEAYKAIDAALSGTYTLLQKQRMNTKVPVKQILENLPPEYSQDASAVEIAKRLPPDGKMKLIDIYNRVPMVAAEALDIRGLLVPQSFIAPLSAADGQD